MIKKFLAVLSGLFFSLVGESQTVTNVVDVFDSLALMPFGNSSR